MDAIDVKEAKFSLKSLGSLGRDEMNLAEFPITLLTDRVPKDQTMAVYQDEIFDERSGLTLSRKLTITAGNYGLTTPVDDEIILALIQLTRIKNNFTNPRVEFTRHELVQLLGWSVGGAKYERIEQSLDRWTSVYLKYENAWRDNRTKTWTTRGFHIIDEYELSDSRSNDAQLDLLSSYIIWGKDIFASFQAGYLKPLDYDLCMGLRNSTAKRMYRFLDKRFHHKSEWIFGLKELAHAHIGLGEHYEGPAHLKRNLQPAIEELEKIGFLEPLSLAERFQKDGKNWKIHLIRRRDASELTTTRELASEPLLPLELVETKLIERGVSEKTAVELAGGFPLNYLSSKIEQFDWEMKQPKPPKRPGGFLVKLITDNYQPPKDYIPPVERQKNEAARKAIDLKAAEERRRKQVAADRDRKERDLINNYWHSLTEDQKIAHDAAAKQQASPENLELLAGPMKRFGMTAIRDNFTRKLLEAKGKLPIV